VASSIGEEQVVQAVSIYSLFNLEKTHFHINVQGSGIMKHLPEEVNEKNSTEV